MNAVIQINSTKGVASSQHKSQASEPAGRKGITGLHIGAPACRIVNLSQAPCLRGIGRLGESSVALPVGPHHPLGDGLQLIRNCHITSRLKWYNACMGISYTGPLGSECL